MRVDPLFPIGAALFVGGLFVASAAHKLHDLRRFGGTVGAYGVVPTVVVPMVALAVATTEVVAGIGTLLIGSRIQPVALSICIALLAFYALLILFSIARGRQTIDCGCLAFGARRPRLRTAMPLRNLIVMIVAFFGLLPTTTRSLIWLDGTALIGGVTMLALLYAGFDLAISLPGKEELA